MKSISFIALNLFVLMLTNNVMAQQKQMVRLAKIQVDPTQLKAYNLALKEQMAAAVQLEQGVLTYYAVAEKKILRTLPF